MKRFLHAAISLGLLCAATNSPAAGSEHVTLTSVVKRVSRDQIDLLIVTFHVKNKGRSNIIIPQSDYRLGDLSGTMKAQDGRPMTGKRYDPLGPKVTKLISTETILSPGKTLVLSDWIINLRKNTAQGFNTRWQDLKKIRGTRIQLNVSFDNPKIKTAECKTHKPRLRAAITHGPKRAPVSPRDPPERGILFCRKLAATFNIAIPK